MGFFDSVKGTWNPFGINIPDYGWTEKFAKPSQTATTFYNPPADPDYQRAQREGGTREVIPTSLAGAQSQTAGSSASSNGSGNATPRGFDPTRHDINAPEWASERASRQSSGEEQARAQAEVAAGQARGEINTGYDQYFSTLDSIVNNLLPQSRTAQEGIATSQGTQAENTLGGAQTQSLADLQSNRETVTSNQGKSLQSLADDIRNQFKAGQITLGARGAADSSAANQYSYAISKLGSQARGNVLQQTAELNKNIQDKEFAVKNTYNTELKNIKEKVNEQIMSVAQWFTSKQTEMQGMKASGQLQRGQDLANLSKQILGQASQQMMMFQQEAANKRGMLDQWAMNNSKTIGEMRTNMAGLSQGVNTGINQPGIGGGISTDAGGNIQGPRFVSQGGSTWNDKSKYPTGTVQGADGKTYTKYSDGSTGPTQWNYTAQ